MSTANLKDVVRERYGQAALRAKADAGSSCCGATVLEACCDPITSNLYDAGQAGEVADLALKASPGCGKGLDADALAKDVGGTFISGFVRATRPAAAACCAPGCCR